MQYGRAPTLGTIRESQQLRLRGEGYKGYKGIGLQLEILADQLLVKFSQPASKIKTNSDKTYTSLDLGKH
eukprot:1149602-Pelagomonas_calceolata.AAC.2